MGGKEIKLKIGDTFSLVYLNNAVVFSLVEIVAKEDGVKFKEPYYKWKYKGVERYFYNRKSDIETAFKFNDWKKVEE